MEHRFLKIISLRWIINYIQSNLSKDQIKGLQEVVDYVDGFEDSFGLELLTTVDFALDECPEIQIIRDIYKWTNNTGHK